MLLFRSTSKGTAKLASFPNDVNPKKITINNHFQKNRDKGTYTKLIIDVCLSLIPASIFRKDSRGREAVVDTKAPVAKVFFARQIDQGPVCRTNADDSAGADAFDDEVGLESNLDAAASQRDFSGRLRDVEDRAS